MEFLDTKKKGWGDVSLYCLCSVIFYWKAYRFVSSRLWISFCFLASLCKDIYPMGLLKIKSYPASARRTTSNSWADLAFSQRATRQHQREKLGQNLCKHMVHGARARPPAAEGVGAMRPLQRPRGAAKWPIRHGDPKSGSWLVTRHLPFGWASHTYGQLANGQVFWVLFLPSQRVSSGKLAVIWSEGGQLL